jgi:hypothetical protein
MSSSNAVCHRRTSYEIIGECAQQHKMADRKPRNGYESDILCSRVEHPFRYLVQTTRWLTHQEMANAVMDLFTHHQHHLPGERMERIGDLGFECQKPGTMAPVRTAVAGPGPPLLLSWQPVASTTSTHKPG